MRIRIWRLMKMCENRGIKITGLGEGAEFSVFGFERNRSSLLGENKHIGRIRRFTQMYVYLGEYVAQTNKI